MTWQALPVHDLSNAQEAWARPGHRSGLECLGCLWLVTCSPYEVMPGSSLASGSGFHSHYDDLVECPYDLQDRPNGIPSLSDAFKVHCYEFLAKQSFSSNLLPTLLHRSLQRLSIVIESCKVSCVETRGVPTPYMNVLCSP